MPSGPNAHLSKWLTHWLVDSKRNNDWLTNILTNLLISWLMINLVTDPLLQWPILNKWPTDQLNCNWLPNRLIYWPLDQLTNLLTHWLPDSLTDPVKFRSTDSLAQQSILSVLIFHSAIQLHYGIVMSVSKKITKEPKKKRTSPFFFSAVNIKHPIRSTVLQNICVWVECIGVWHQCS